MSKAWQIDDAYVEIDPILERWAARNHLAWQKEYKDYSVRSYSYPLAGTENVQFWVDPPKRGAAAIHVALNSTSSKRRRLQQSSYSFDDLESGLDEALKLALDWRDQAF